MDFIFLRINKEAFKLIPTRSCSKSENRLTSLIRREIDDKIRGERFFDRTGQESNKFSRDSYYWDPAKKIIGYAMRYPKYKFWNMITLQQESFQYNSPLSVEAMFKKVVDENQYGMTMETAISEIKRQLKWQQLTRCK